MSVAVSLIRPVDLLPWLIDKHTVSSGDANCREQR